LAFEVRKEVQDRLPRWVTLTRNFLPNSVIYEKATTNNLAATVGFSKRANFTKLLEEGGVRTPKSKALAIPVDVKTNKSGGITAGNRPAAVLMKKGVFSGVIDGIAGIWQKGKRIPIRLLYVFKSNAKYKTPFLQFKVTADQVVQAKSIETFKNALLKMLSK